MSYCQPYFSQKNILLFYKSAQICYYWRSENANLGWRRLKRNFIFHGLLKWPIWWFDNGDKQFKNESHPDRNIVIKKQQEMQRLKMQIFKFYTGGHYHYYYHHNIRRSLVIWYCNMVKVLSSHIPTEAERLCTNICIYDISWLKNTFSQCIISWYRNFWECSPCFGPRLQVHVTHWLNMHHHRWCVKWITTFVSKHASITAVPNESNTNESQQVPSISIHTS